MKLFRALARLDEKCLLVKTSCFKLFENPSLLIPMDLPGIPDVFLVQVGRVDRRLINGPDDMAFQLRKGDRFD